MRMIQKFVFSGLGLALFVIRTWKPGFLPSDAMGLALLVLIALPWLDVLIKAAELPGGWKIEFRDLQQKVELQQEIINNLVRYSMSASIFHHLCGLALLYQYRYIDSETNRRELYFLRDNGFIMPKGRSFLDFGADQNGQNLV